MNRGTTGARATTACSETAKLTRAVLDLPHPERILLARSRFSEGGEPRKALFAALALASFSAVGAAYAILSLLFQDGRFVGWGLDSRSREGFARLMA